MFTDTKKISEAGAWVHIKNEGRKMYADDGKGNADESKPVRIKLLGPHSPTLQRRMAERNARRIQETGGTVDLAKMGVAQIEDMILKGPEAIAENWADATLTWENMPEGVAPFSKEAAEALYLAYPDLPEQLQKEAGDMQDFLRLAKAS